jgi:hypothetical protein
MGIEEIQKDLEKHTLNITNACPFSGGSSLRGSVEVTNFEKNIHVQVVAD